MQHTATLRPTHHCNALLVDAANERLVCSQYEHDSASDTRSGAVDCCPIGAVVGPDPALAPCLTIADGVFDLYAVDATVAGVAAPFVGAFTDGSCGVFPRTAEQPPSAAWTAWPSEHMATSVAVLADDAVVTTHHQGLAARVDIATKAAHCWQAHLYDTWCSAALPGNTLATGGDDGRLCLWDLRALPDAVEGDEPETAAATPVAAARCGAGVVFVAPLSSLASGPVVDAEHLLVAGSYDEKLMLFDRRSIRRPVAECGVGGGAWRARKGPTADSLVVAAMHGGAALLHFDPGAAAGNVFTHELQFHDDTDNVLVYDAVTVAPGVVATTSFYENEIRIWRHGGPQ